MKVVIIGCGLIGRKRACALTKEDELIACCDLNFEAADKFGKEFSCYAYDDYKKILKGVDFDAAVVAVTNKYARDIVKDALKFDKHVLAEKPLGRNVEEAKDIVGGRKHAAVSKKYIVLKTGFNHRFHPAIWKAKQFADENKIGKIINIRARYGHGGRPGMETEWRASKDLCGGGELLDQGVHIIDLVRWFGGEICEVYGRVETKFWNMEVEDNAFAILKTQSNVTASFHVSWTNWKNIFSFEIFGTDGYLRIEGLGGSYGQETLELGIRKKEGGRPDIEIFEFPPDDISWVKEWEEFKIAIKEKREPIGSGIDGLKANEVIETIYRSSEGEKAVFL